MYLKKYVWVLWRWWKADCVKEVRMRELRVRELLVRRLCVSKLCVWESVCELCRNGGRYIVRKRYVWESCVRESCWVSCVWESCVWESVCVCVSGVEMVEERLCERVVCETVVCERVVWKSCVWNCCVVCAAKDSCAKTRERSWQLLIIKSDVAKCHTCHTEWRSMLPNATPATQTATALTGTKPSAISATPATQSEGRCHQVPRPPYKVTVDVTERHVCHANSRGA